MEKHILATKLIAYQKMSKYLPVEIPLTSSKLKKTIQIIKQHINKILVAMMFKFVEKA
jgi:hypothetical protein